MKVFDQIEPLMAQFEQFDKKHSIGFVPTMGALHDGHIELIKQAKNENQIVVCSIFINKIQFNNEEDFIKYPKNIDKDIQLLNEVDCDYLLIPTQENIFPATYAYKNYSLGNIEYTVEEKSSDQIELSGGYGAGRIVGTLGLTFNNFSLKRIFEPNSWQPLPSGDGQKLSLRAQTNGTFFQSYTFSFTEPWLGGKKPNSLSTWINHSQFGTGLLRSNPNYSGISISGAGVGFGRRKKFPDDFFNAYYELAYQYYDVSNYQSFFPSFSNGYAFFSIGE